ncbi:MAG: AMP-binding protein [Actinomycetes bacterium]
MSTRTVARLTVQPGPAGVLAVASALPAALLGDGPALALLPAGPAQLMERLLARIRPDDPTNPLETPDVAIVVATSGSTGEPQGVLLTAANLIRAAQASDARLGGPARWVLALPVDHVGGLAVLVRSHLAGVPVLPIASIGGAATFSAEEFRRTTETARSLADRDGTPLRTALVPTQLSRLVELGPAAQECLTAYDTILVGGAAAPTGLLDSARKLGAMIVTTYGMTETCGGVVYDGYALDDVTVSITEPDAHGFGRIELTGPTVAVGYRLQPDLTERYFAGPNSAGVRSHRTRDCGHIGSTGTLTVSGRLDDVVKVGGMKVSIAAVEAAAQRAPGVREAAVVATHDPEWGSLITAFVTTEPAEHPAENRIVGGVTRWVENTLGKESRPRDVLVLSTLPTLPNGKIDRSALRRIAADRRVPAGPRSNDAGSEG